MFVNFDTKINTYRCKLSTRSLVELEDKLGDNPINVIGSMATNKLPRLATLLTMLYYSMKDMNHGIKYDDIYAIYDEYLDNGGNIMTLMEFIMNVFVESGIIGKPEEKEEDEEENNEAEHEKN